MAFPDDVDEGELNGLAKNNPRVFNVIKAYASHVLNGAPINNCLIPLGNLKELEMVVAVDIIRGLNASVQFCPDTVKDRIANASNKVHEKLDAMEKKAQTLESNISNPPQPEKQSLPFGYQKIQQDQFREQEKTKRELKQPEPDVLIQVKQDVLALLDQRLAAVDKELKGFRKGHTERKFALEEIKKEVKAQTGQFSLGEIEAKIAERLEKEGLGKHLDFAKGTRSDSTAHKGKDSQYQEMKIKIDAITEKAWPTPKRGLSIS